MSGQNTLLLTGATGYIGGRLLFALEKSGRKIRCLARRPEFLKPRVRTGTEIVAGDVLDPASLCAALRGIKTAFYLIHSMGSLDDFEARDKEGALNFSRAARDAGVERIIYLGGLASGPQLSAHLSSRHQVGEILRASGIPTIELRASIIIGSGSLSFEMIRTIVERLPVMITPRWVRIKAQPIGVEDVISYLVEAMDLPLDRSEVFEIGGTDQVSYGEIMLEYARQRHLRRWMIPVPFLTPWLSSLWLGFITPLYARIGRKLMTSMRHPTIITDTRAAKIFSIMPRGVSETIARALNNEDKEFAETRWSDSVSSKGAEREWGGRRMGARIIDSRRRRVNAPVSSVYASVERLGGENGWLSCNGLWRLRGVIDLLFGGVGMRRGRPKRGYLIAGDALDFWRVEDVDRDKRIRLYAEMLLPGRAWLQFDIQTNGSETELVQTATFDPLGLSGLIYWYALYPLHAWIFQNMLDALALRAEKDTSG